jgi:hypothetical protein
LKRQKQVKTKQNRHINTCVITLGVAALVQQASAATIDLGTSADFAILSGTGVTDAGAASAIIGNVGVSPTTGASITGLTAGQVGGTIYSVDGFGPAGSINNPGLLTIAKNDLGTAYTAAANAVPPTSTIPNQLNGQNLVAGIYKFDAGDVNLAANGVLTLSGSGLFIFQVPSTLTTISGSSMHLINGADACNVIWQVSKSAALGGAFFDGTILANTSITLTAGETVAGRLLAETGNVTLDHDTIVTDIGCQPGAGTGSFHTTDVPGVVGLGRVPDSGSTVLLLGFGLASLIGFRAISRQNQLQAGY